MTVIELNGRGGEKIEGALVQELAWESPSLSGCEEGGF